MKNKRVSFKNRTVFIMLLLVVPSVICLIAFNLYTTNTTIKSQVAQSNKSKLTLFTTTLENNLKNIAEFMQAITVLDPAFTVLQYNVGTVNAHVSAFNILQKCKYILASQSAATGFFIYSQKNDLYRQIYNTNLPNNERVNISEQLRGVLKQEDLNTRGWFVQKINGQNYLFRVVAVNGGSLVCLVKLENTIAFSDFAEDEFFFYTTQQGEALTAAAVLEDAGNKVQIRVNTDPFYLTGRVSPYLAVQQSSE